MIPPANNYTIIFTDSGLGGLSIMADFYNAIKNKFIDINELNIIFFNALQESGNGYNSMSSVEEKSKIFNAALLTIAKLYRPHKIAIACNTLSSIYPKTPFSKQNYSILEIISCGILQIKEHLQQSPEIPVFILATPTTLDSNAYKIENENVFYISGGNLASLIEFNYMMQELRDKVYEMFKVIKTYLMEKTEFSLFFGCTHYAYITTLFQEVSEDFGLNIKNIIDPAIKFNKLLIDQLPGESATKLKTKINLRVESQAQILKEEIDSVSNMIKDKSPELTHLLRNYNRLPKTF